ncbi:MULTISPECIES: hypothetical protein [Halolamina]|uniref:SipW-cognate class signal peptide n=1 Tax=Halolamina pelagica TaxID=699431 RepID=A0A1I5TQU6_9EURY|nr:MULTISPECIES: hypothetical protein [Halolamina]NHX37769.1 hypothetical protein [Halolamina sp. R1-12]SFP85358.1 hypothetical protein SAMN05216277_11050 [Halolamina pelagica]
MQRRTVIASVGAILGTSVGTAAYTSATVTRDATFAVATDASSALIGLNAGTTAGVTESGDALSIAVQDLNTDGTFVYGDGANIDTSHAFSIINNDGSERSFTLGYDTAGVTFELFQQGTDWTDATSLGTVDSTTDVTWTAAAAEEIRAVMTIDTTGVASGATDLDGTLTVSAN